MHRLIADGITAAPEDIAWADAVLLDAIEGPAAAMPVLTGLLDALPGRLALIAQDPSTTAEMVRIALGAGDRNRAGLVVAGARRLAEANRAVHSLAAAAAHADGVYRADPDRLCQAVEAFRGTPRVLALAAALTDAAANRYAARDIAAAQAYADEALDVAGRTGARRLTIRLERLRGGRPAPATAEDTGPECLRPLTPAERRVAVLVAKGLSNLEVADKLFLSRHTVDSHLRRIFSKLEIKRRADLILMAAEHLGTP
jgi:DNA-binding CsgD family transcriptional regulator